MKDFDDVKKFAEQVGLKESSEDDIDSPFALLIQDIDQPEDREAVFEVLSHCGVDLDLTAIKKQIDEGHVLISRLNEARAALIADKIKDLEVDIRFGLLKDLLPGKK